MLKYLIFLTLTLCLVNCFDFYDHFLNSLESHELGDNSDEKPWSGTIWAVLVAGSNGWFNYRHQADICHAYQVLHEHGVNDSNIIVMMYDDIAHNEENPTKGVIINKPNGRDVYKGVPKDYIGKEVTPKMLLKVLEGDQSLHQKGKKVVKSGPNDHIFLYFADHGAPGLIAFPSDELYAKDLNKVLKSMANKKKFNKMVIYIEACESGSMFAGLLPTNINIFATTAANSSESSYACYYDDQRETYLGDVYSVNWIEDSDAQHSLIGESLQQQFKRVLRETNTSHVTEFGDISIGKLPLSQFQGSKRYNKTSDGKVEIRDAVASSDVPLVIAMKRLNKHNQTEEQRFLNRFNYEELLRARSFLINSVKHLIHELNIKLYSVDSIWSDRRVLTNHNCYVDLIQHFDNHCFDLSTHPFALRFLYIFVNICETLEPNEGNARIIESWISSIVKHCSLHISDHPFTQIL
ncbi:legumain-like [Oppia nitens]|uniref:legumain-like n=1 Tax=Oppia nitens TaxID=1686743 RepID=UPI0023DABCD0|nr:legumain-like [Oppia nitens]